MKNIVINKIKLIYTSKVIYLMLFCEVAFLLIYALVNNFVDVKEFLGILKNDIFLWIIFMPSMIVIHKSSVFNTSYNVVSRFSTNKDIMYCDYATIILSTFICTLIVILAPILLNSIFNLSSIEIFTWKILFNILFLIIRYYTLSVLIQCLSYVIMFKFQIMQKYNNSICFIPIILFFIITFPLEYISTNSGYVPALDFTAGKHYNFEKGYIVNWMDLLLTNIHILGYTVFFLWFSFDYLTKRLEFNENGNSNN